jgi:hypothetical protein
MIAHRRAGASLSLVRDGQPFSSFRATPLQNNPAVFRRHSNPETVRFLPASGVGLVGPLPFHGVLSAGRIGDPEALKM